MLLATDTKDDICEPADAEVDKPEMMLLITDTADETWEGAGAVFEAIELTTEAMDETAGPVGRDPEPVEDAETTGVDAIGPLGSWDTMLLATEIKDEICGPADAEVGRSEMMLLITDTADEI